MFADYNALLVALIPFLGIFLGDALSRISPEEMKPGKKYFRFFEVFFLILIVVLALILIKIFLINIFLLIMGIILAFLIKRIYLYIAIILFSSPSNLLFLFSSLTFIYSLFYGTLENPIKRWKLLILDAILFFASGFIILYFSLNLAYLGIGGLVTLIYFKLRLKN